MDRPGLPAVAREAAILAVVAGIQLGVVTVAAVHTSAAAPGAPRVLPLAPAGYVLLAAAVVLLPLRHLRPVGALAGVFALTLGYWSAGFPGGPVFAALVVAFGRVVAEGRRRTAIGVAVAGFVLFPWLGVLVGRRDPPNLGFLLGLAAWLVALISVVEALRLRRERARATEASRAEAARRQAGEERLRIARELHDAVAHAMSLITIQAGVALHRGEDLPAETRQALTVIRGASRESLVELRSILGVLRDVDGAAPRAPVPGLSRLGDLAEWARHAGLDLRLSTEGPVGELPRAVDVAAYRILQEALTNVARHARAEHVRVDVAADGDAVTLAVEDDGAGGAAPVAGPEPGNGIAGMRERAGALGGTLDAGPRPGGGFAVHARLPLREAS